MDVHTLLDPSYGFFLDEPSSEWTLEALPGIRDRVHSGYTSSQNARGYQQWTPSVGAAPPVRLCIYRPTTKAIVGKRLPALLYLHGGGFVLGRPEMADDYLAELANDLKVVVIAPDYRLAPEHPFPAPLEDCYAALDWVFLHAASLGIDHAKVAIMGHSAGGGLAAALALLVRDRCQRQLAGLVMIYPMLDHRTGSPAMPAGNPTTGRLSWSRQANQFCWQCMQGAFNLNDNCAYLLSPALATHLSGLAPSFICVGALDLFLEEDVAFALKLSSSGVPTEMHVYPGVPHMFDQYPGAASSRCKRDVQDALQRMWGVELPV